MNSHTLPVQMPRGLRILVTGGGTGGHATPAVATIEAIRAIAEEQDWAPTFLYLGSNHGVERKIAQELSVDFAGIETGKLRRSRKAWGVLSAANFADALRVPIGYAQALAEVRRFHPDVVLSTGGYVSVPGILAASALGSRIVAHEQTVQVGLANRINFQLASRIALSFEETLHSLRVKLRDRAEVTGNPVRSIIFGGDAARAADFFGFDLGETSLPAVYITGGAQGSSLINHAVAQKLLELTQICRIIHQCGVQPNAAKQDFDTLNEARVLLPADVRKRYAVAKYVGSEIGDVYTLADLVIGRSGAGTVSEICALGKPALFIPLVPTGGDEQTRNADRMVNAGAAEIIKQDDLSGETLLLKLRTLLADRQRLLEMGKNSLGLASPDAAKRLANLVIELGKKALN